MVCLLALMVRRADADGGVGAYAGHWLSKDFGDASGVGGKAYFDFSVLRLQVNVGYFSGFEADDRSLSMDVMPLEAAAIVHVPLGLYGGVGGGYYRLDSDSRYSMDNPTGYFACAGWLLGLHWVSFFAEARYTQVEVEVDGAFLSSEKLMLDGVNVYLGAALQF